MLSAASSHQSLSGKERDGLPFLTVLLTGLAGAGRLPVKRRLAPLCSLLSGLLLLASFLPVRTHPAGPKSDPLPVDAISP